MKVKKGNLFQKGIRLSLFIAILFGFVMQLVFVLPQYGQSAECTKCLNKCKAQYEKDSSLCNELTGIAYQYCKNAADRAKEQCIVFCNDGGGCNGEDGGGSGEPCFRNRIDNCIRTPY